jgi:hypothetical protein
MRMLKFEARSSTRTLGLDGKAVARVELTSKIFSVRILPCEDATLSGRTCSSEHISTHSISEKIPMTYNLLYSLEMAAWDLRHAAFGPRRFRRLQT